MGYPAEPFASWVDCVSAGAAVEGAIHAGAGPAAAAALAEAASQLEHAAAYWTTFGQVRLAQADTAAAKQLLAYADQVRALSGPDLATFQQQTLYPYQGTIAGLCYSAQSRWPAHAVPVNPWIVAGSILGAAGLALTVVGLIVVLRRR